MDAEALALAELLERRREALEPPHARLLERSKGAGRGRHVRARGDRANVREHEVLGRLARAAVAAARRVAAHKERGTRSNLAAARCPRSVDAASPNLRATNDVAVTFSSVPHFPLRPMATTSI